MRLPRTYKELLAGDHEGWQVETVYYLELEGSLAGILPALMTGTRRAIIALDQALLGRAQAYLPMRHSRISSTRFLVNRREGIGYPMWDDGEPKELFTADELKKAVSRDPWPFQWAQGLPGDMREFTRILESTDRREENLSFAAAAAVERSKKSSGVRW